MPKRTNAIRTATGAMLLAACDLVLAAHADARSAHQVGGQAQSAAPAWSAEGGQVSAQLGYALASAGDVNGDGFSDVIVAATFYDNGSADEGRVLAYQGSATGLASTPARTLDGNHEGAWFGYSVAAAGDVDGDGYQDVIVGALYDGANSQGRAFLYRGSPSGLAATPAWMAEGSQQLGEFGYSVASAGDVNGDGYDDVIVGAESTGDGGRAFLYQGSASGLAGTPSWTVQSDQVFANFGNSVASAGDVNGDGYDDVLVAAYTFDDGDWDEGRVFLYLGSAAGLATTPSWSAEGDQQNAWFGYQVASAGDVDGDGFDDVIVGAYQYDDGETNEGRAFLYRGSASGLASQPSWSAEGDQASAAFGCSVASAGDVNGDGYDDVIVGAIRYDDGEGDEGRAFVYYGSAAGLAASPSWSAESNQAGAEFGYAVGSAGDVNGDGYADVIVGAWGYDDAHMDEGRAVVYHGSAHGLPTGSSSGRAGRLVVAKTGTSELALSWGASCLASDADYAIYEGTLGDFTSHAARSCGTAGTTSKTLTPLPDNTYYLIVPLGATREGSYGTSSLGERPAAVNACLPQEIAACN